MIKVDYLKQCLTESAKDGWKYTFIISLPLTLNVN